MKEEIAQKWMFNCIYLLIICTSICLCFFVLEGTIAHFVRLRIPVEEMILQRYDSYERRLAIIEKNLNSLRNTAVFKKYKKPILKPSSRF